MPFNQIAPGIKTSHITRAPPCMALIYSTALFVVCSLNWALPDSDLLWPDCLPAPDTAGW